MADTKHTRTTGKSQADTTYATNTSQDIGAADWKQEQRDIYESVAVLISTNVLTEDNIFGEIDHTQVFGATSISDYDNTSEVPPTVHIYCDDEYGIAIENTDNADADTKRFLFGQNDSGDFTLSRISESGGTDTKHESLNVDQNDHLTLGGALNLSKSGLTIAAGEITITGSSHGLNTESAASTDDLDTINGGTYSGQILILSTNSNSQDVVVKDNTGNIRCGSDQTLSTVRDRIMLEYSTGTSTWYMVSYSSN